MRFQLHVRQYKRLMGNASETENPPGRSPSRPSQIRRYAFSDALRQRKRVATTVGAR
jgi:hypothetical protein